MAVICCCSWSSSVASVLFLVLLFSSKGFRDCCVLLCFTNPLRALTRFRVVWRQSVHWFPAQQNVVTCLARWTWAQMCHAHTLVSSPHFTTLLINTTLLQNLFPNSPTWSTWFKHCPINIIHFALSSAFSHFVCFHITPIQQSPIIFSPIDPTTSMCIISHFHKLSALSKNQQANKAHDNHQHTIMHLINVVLCVNRVTPCSIINNSLFINRLALNKSIHLSLLDRVCDHELQTQATHCWQTTPSGALIWRISKE